MNCNKFIRGLAVLCISAFLLVSCQKENFGTAETATQNYSNLKRSGTLPDDPTQVARIPMVASAGFIANNIPDYFSGLQQEESVRSGGKGGRDRTSPTLSFINPVSGSSVSNTVAVQVNATDNVGVTAVVLKVDGSAIGTSTSAPFNFNWNTAGLANGTHTLTATASDAAGNSKVISIQVGYNTPAGSDITPPSVTITSPTNGAGVNSTTAVNIAASDNIGVIEVTLQVDGIIQGTDATAPYSFSWNTTNSAAGIHSLLVTARDAAGNSSSNSIQVMVNTTIIPETSLPSSFQLITPPVGNQGNEGSCVPFAIAYAARSIEQYYTTNATGYSFDTNIFSPEYVYNQTRMGDCGAGSSIVQVLDLIKNQGVSTWQSMPYSDLNGCSLQPTSSQILNASLNKISSYVTIANTDQVAIKTMIASKHPVITNVIADNGFMNATAGFTWKAYSGSGALPHTIIICGYDDNRQAYKVMNSWGTAWGDAGFSWIDYSYFLKVSSYNTYVIQ